MGGIQVTNHLQELAEWLVDLDEPDSQPRRSVSLSVIVERAKAALSMQILEDKKSAPMEVGRATCTPVEDSVLERVRLSSGQQLIAHPAFMCEGEICCIHTPSDHHMRGWSQLWRDDRKLMERTCSHGVGHPDPDDIAYRIKHMGLESAYIDAIHGCDGCCGNVNYFTHLETKYQEVETSGAADNSSAAQSD